MTIGSIGGYRILRRLGVGGMGEVFLARQESAAGLGRAVVIKVVNTRSADDREARARFLDEARLALQLRHRNICGVTHVGEAEGRTFLVMDYVAGRDLRDVLAALEERGRRISPALAIYIWKEILDALDYAHRMVDPRTGAPLGIVHRDVSPSNVMISLEGEVQLIDFGTAVSSWKVERTAAGQVFGKVRYMSPEHARGEVVDARSDVYSAAIVGTELFAGLPFRERMDDRALLEVTQRGERTPLLDLLDVDVRALLERALTPDRAQRASAGEMVRACEELLVARRDVVGPADVRSMMREVFPEELARQRERLAEVLADGPASDANKSDVVFFSRLQAAVNDRDDAKPAREVTQIVRTRGPTRPITTTEEQNDGALSSRAHTQAERTQVEPMQVEPMQVERMQLERMQLERTRIEGTLIERTQLADDPTLLSQPSQPGTQSGTHSSAHSGTQPIAVQAGAGVRLRIITLGAATLLSVVAVVIAAAWIARDGSPVPSVVDDRVAAVAAVAVVDDRVAQASALVDAGAAVVQASTAEPTADAAVDEPAVDAPAVDEPVVDEPVVDEPVVDEPAGSGTRRPVVKKHPPVSSMSLGQKLAALKACGARNACAKTLLARGAANKTADETRAFLVEVDRCVVQCLR